MMRKWNRDVFVEDTQIRIVVDITGYLVEDLFVGISEKLNSLVILYDRENNKSIDIPIPVKVKDEFEIEHNNNVMTILIERFEEDGTDDEEE